MKSNPRSKAISPPPLSIVVLIFFLLLSILGAWLVTKYILPRRGEAPSQGARGAYPHLLLGNPSGATTSPGNKNNYLMPKKYFALSYNNGKGIPNWVSWRLTRADLGSAPRGQFYPDETLPRGFARITPRDYTGGGFDRGHMCPHSDRSANEAMSRATFVMTNIIPQSPNVNQKAWEQLESYCRSLVEREGKTLYIVSGPAGRGGEGREGRRDTIGQAHHVTVPAKCWKVVLVLGAGAGGAEDAARVSRNTRLIAVIMPNDMTVGENWARYRVPVKEVEQLTGYTFFDKAPAEVIGPLKETVDKVRIPAPRPARRGKSNGN